MKRIVFLSGKGGTGKTTLAAAYASRADNLVIVDADVDAANLHLVFRPEVIGTGSYQGSKTAVHDAAQCTACGRCLAVCRFAAIRPDFTVDELLCEGCGSCVTVCPSDAMTLVERTSGEWYVGRTAHGTMVGAELYPGEEVSGKLVSVVKEKADDLASSEAAQWIAIDGSPGIGCPVIASTTGTQAAVLVTEPSRSGLHDLERILGVVHHFGIPAYVIINKADLSEPLAGEIAAFAERENLPLLGRIPYDTRVIDALQACTNPIDDPESPAGQAMERAIARLMDELGNA